MWKHWLFILIWLVVVIPAEAQQNVVYLPLIIKPDCEMSIMSDFKIIIGEGTTNLVLNPSGETTSNYAAETGTTVTRSTTYQKYGLYSYRVETNANNEGIQFTLSTLANAIHYATVRVRGTLPAAWDWSLNGSNFTSPALIEQIDANWKLYGLQFSAAQSNGSTLLEIHQNGVGSGDFYLDGIQVEQKEYWTTYCDGAQEGCAWLGATNASSSERSAASRAGGRVRDLQTDYYFNIGGIVGGGAPPQSVSIDSYAILPGGEFNSLKTKSRVITLSGVFSASSTADLHQKQANLLTALKGDNYPSNQPVLLQYHGATTHKEISLYYESGLEGDIEASIPCWEKAAIRFIAPDPYWYETGESAILLDTNDSATFRTVAARLKSTGQWSALGPPNAAGTYTFVQAIVEDSTYVYFGGSFLNFDNIANADNIVRYNKTTGVYSAMGSGLNGIVYTMIVASNGDIYIGGAFTNAGGVAAADYLTRWDGSNFNAVGTPNTGAAAIINPFSLLFDQSGNLIIAGSFNNWADIAAADNIVMWDGSNYSALGSGLSNSVSSVALGNDNTLFLAGLFTNAGGVADADFIAAWDGSNYSALSSTIPNGQVTELAVDKRTGILYLSGTFTNIGNRIAAWNGASYLTLGEGVNLAPSSLIVSDDGTVFVGGAFSTAFGLSLSDRIARWNGFTGSSLDINLPGTPIVYSILAGKSDPVIQQKYDLFISFDTAGTGYYAGKVSPSNEGSVPAYPQIVFERSGGTTAIVETLRNETTGKELLLNYSLLNGERLTLNLDPTQRTITSSFFGSRPDAVLANSDFGTWTLIPGSQDVTSFVATTGSPTVTAWLQWREAFVSY